MRLRQTVGNNIRKLRKTRGLSQEALAEEAGLAMRYVSGIERGEENPTVDVLEKLAKALEVSAGSLLSEPRGRS